MLTNVDMEKTYILRIPVPHDPKWCWEVELIFKLVLGLKTIIRGKTFCLFFHKNVLWCFFSSWFSLEKNVAQISNKNLAGGDTAFSLGGCEEIFPKWKLIKNPQQKRQRQISGKLCIQRGRISKKILFLLVVDILVRGKNDYYPRKKRDQEFFGNSGTDYFKQAKKTGGERKRDKCGRLSIINDHTRPVFLAARAKKKSWQRIMVMTEWAVQKNIETGNWEVKHVEMRVRTASKKHLK